MYLINLLMEDSQMLFGKSEKITLKVGGMSCKHCAARVEAALKTVDGVKKVDITLEKAEVAVTCRANAVKRDALKRAVTAAGYTVEE